MKGFSTTEGIVDGPRARLTLSDLSPETLADLRDRLRFDDAQVAELIEAVNDGVRTVGDYVGIDAAAANTLENAALAYYRLERFDLAATLYHFILELHPQRVSAWRGLGACAQGGKAYDMAIVAYLMGLHIDPNDVASQVLVGECHCLAGRRDAGIGALKLALTLKAREPWEQAFLRRAESIVAADGAVVPSPEKKSQPTRR